eukprot:jgi/Mesen1/8317/ME000457S07511
MNDKILQGSTSSPMAPKAGMASTPPERKRGRTTETARKSGADPRRLGATSSSIDGSVAGFDSLEKLLEEYLPETELQEAMRILHGCNEGAPVAAQDLPVAAKLAATIDNYDLQAYSFTAAPEQMRAPRIVKLALVQNAIVVPTSAPYAEQRRAIMDRVSKIIDTAGSLGVNVLCLQARNAAIANSYYVGAINRVGTETFPNAFTSGDGKPAHKDFGHFYGSSYFAAPDGSRTPGLSRCRDGLLVADVDLNLCQQVRDKWGFRMTARYNLYAKLLTNYVQPDYEPQVVRDPSLP